MKILCNSLWRQLPLYIYLLLSISHTVWAKVPASHPRQVTIRIELKSIDKINSHAQTFRANFYIYADWVDPAACRASTFHNGVLDWHKIWTPDLEYINDIDNAGPRRFTYEVVNKQRCQIEYWANIISEFQSEMHLKKFPFDSQKFPIIIESYEYDINKLEFRVDSTKAPKKVSKGLLYSLCNDSKVCNYFTDENVILSNPEWKYKSFKLLLDKHAYKLEGTLYSRARFSLKMRRNYGFYLWKVIVPLALIASLSWLIFMTGAENYLARLSASFTLFLSSVTFSLFTKSTLPAIPYLVLIDYYTLGTFFMIFTSALISTVVYRLSVKADKNQSNSDRLLAESIDKWSLWVFPAAYVIYCALCTLIIL